NNALSERAKAFWKKEDIDDVFHVVFGYLGNLKRVLKKNTATDRGELMVPEDSLSSPCSSPAAFSPNRDFSAAASPGDLLPPLTPVQLHYRPHTCSKVTHTHTQTHTQNTKATLTALPLQACLTTVPIMPQSVPLFWGQNPLKIPLLCGFKRLTARLPLTEGAELEDSEDSLDGDVIYKTPCGLSLRNYDDVMSFLLDTESYDILQVDFFTYNPFIQLDPPPSDRHQLPELDLSRGIEPTPVELCLGEGGAKPPNFRYRKDRWPHGCFLSRSLKLFSTCCDCVDGCSDAKQCACVVADRATLFTLTYVHSVYECGPWCGCDRARCQNRLVQRGIRLRLQVFQTDNCGWGVRCRDDLDRGMFVCTYAGELVSASCVILQRAQSSITPPSPKLPRIELPSDDEVQVVTEWLVPSQEDGKSAVMEGSSPPLHVPVIQRPADAKTPQDRDKVRVYMLMSGVDLLWSLAIIILCE
uniref:Pre-SET domain-containing protein n=1 Tax=Takifugu rubripes TaxID=31033 RepID=A0A674PAH2_TAKRU